MDEERDEVMVIGLLLTSEREAVVATEEIVLLV